MKRLAVDRKTFLQAVGAGSIAAALPSALSSLVTPAEAQGTPPNGAIEFIFVSQSFNDAAKQVLVMTGAGTFTPSQVAGGGRYVNVDAAAGKIITHGIWNPTGFVSWTPVGTFGEITAGILVMTAQYTSQPDGKAVFAGQLSVVCDADGFNTGKEEGFYFAPSGGTVPTFEPHMPAVGLTAFTAPSAIPLAATLYQPGGARLRNMWVD